MLCQKTQQLSSTVDKHSRQSGVATQEKYYVISLPSWESAGVGRVPVGHTCGFTLELPSTYENLCAMREEFNNILSADNWEMNFV